MQIQRSIRMGMIKFLISKKRAVDESNPRLVFFPGIRRDKSLFYF